MGDEKTLSSKVIFEGRAVKLRLDTVQMPSGRQTTREVVEHSDCVAIIAVDAEKNVLLVKQYRQPVDKDLLEIPAGGIDPGESPEEAVKRELREETGYLPNRIEKLGGFYTVPGYGTEYLYLYFATDLTYSPLYAEDTEIIKLVRMPLEQAKELVASGEIHDAKTIAGLLTFFESGRDKI